MSTDKISRLTFDFRLENRSLKIDRNSSPTVELLKPRDFSFSFCRSNKLMYRKDFRFSGVLSDEKKKKTKAVRLIFVLCLSFLDFI